MTTALARKMQQSEKTFLFRYLESFCRSRRVIWAQSSHRGNLPAEIVPELTSCTETFLDFAIEHILSVKMKYPAWRWKLSETIWILLKGLFSSRNIPINYQRTSRSGCLSHCPLFFKVIEPMPQTTCRGCWRSVFHHAPPSDGGDVLQLDHFPHILLFDCFPEHFKNVSF